MKKIDLCGNWKVFNEKTGEFAGKVPGCVTTDLIRAGKVYGEKEKAVYGPKDSIFYRDNAKRIQWIERENFTYEKTFAVDSCGESDRNAKLVFECLDTYANVTLNGQFLGRTDDMHIRYEFDVDGIIRKGRNVLVIEFLSPVKETEELPKRPAAFTAERLYTRRMQCTYGWDWVYRFVTCGIERSCYIIFEDKFAVDNAYIYTLSADSETAQVNAVVKLKNYEQTGYVYLTVEDEKGNVVYKKKRYVAEEYFTEYINVDEPKLWFPNGYGKQPLYTLKIKATDKEGGNEEFFEEKFGIRTVKIIQKKDVPCTPAYEMSQKLKSTPSGKEYDHNEESSSFTLCINGRKILCRGGNWVPCDTYVSEESDRKITRLLTLAKEGGFNMVRIWGGGIFEKSHFYSECDRLGILVTQDFLMACGHYPEEKQQFLDRVAKEAECAAIRLRNHPCLVWWSGDNENAVGGHEAMESYHGREVALKAIAPVLRKLDYNRHFLPSSPYGGNVYASKTVGTTHNTQFLGYFFEYMLRGDGETYKDTYKEYLARFIAEEPSLGAVSPVSLRTFMTDEDIYGNDESMWYFHTQTNPGCEAHIVDYMKSYAGKMLGEFTDGRDRVLKLRYLQCEWVRISMELVRRNMFYSSGIVYWMLNDCWPAAAGWAFLDYYCRTKDSFYSFRRCAGKIVASIDKEDGRYDVYLSSVNPAKEKYVLRLTKVNTSKGKIVSAEEFAAECAGDSACLVKSIVCDLAENEMYVLDVTKNGKNLYRTYYREGSLPVKENSGLITVTKLDGSVKVRANGYVQNVFLDGDYVFEDNCFVMLPGEERTLTYKKNICFGRDAKVSAGDIEVTAFGIK